MTDTQQTIDLSSINASIMVLKKQREMAMDDVADLMGRLESLTVKYNDLLATHNQSKQGSENETQAGTNTEGSGELKAAVEESGT